jgi:hypothetical protein
MPGGTRNAFCAAMPFQLIDTNSKVVRLYGSGSLTLVKYLSTGTVGMLDELLRYQRSLVATHGHISLLQVIPAEQSKWDDAFKKKAADVTRELERHMICSAIVIPGSSLGAMMLRTMVTGINMLSRSKLATKCFGTVPEGLHFLQGLPGQDAAVKAISPDEVEAITGFAMRKAA